MKVCYKYNNKKVPCKYQHIVPNLTNTKTIKVLKQDKGRGVVIMDNKNEWNELKELLLLCAKNVHFSFNG